MTPFSLSLSPLSITAPSFNQNSSQSISHEILNSLDLCFYRLQQKFGIKLNLAFVIHWVYGCSRSLSAIEEARFHFLQSQGSCVLLFIGFHHFRFVFHHFRIVPLSLYITFFFLIF